VDPIPPLLIQERVAAVYRAHQEDALTSLTNFLSPETENPLVKWIDDCTRQLEQVRADRQRVSSAESGLYLFGGPMRSATEGNDRLEEVPEIQDWALDISRLQKQFAGANEIEQGAGQYALIQSGIAKLYEALARIRGTSMIAAKARDLTQICIEHPRHAARQFFGGQPVGLHSTTSELIAGEDNEVNLVVSNLGHLPLRSVEVQFLHGVRSIGYLAEGAKSSVSIPVRPPRKW
jgi:hypothetical protein